jgi:hypothetical protein
LASLEVVNAVAPIEVTAIRAITVFFIASPFQVRNAASQHISAIDVKEPTSTISVNGLPNSPNTTLHEVLEIANYRPQGIESHRAREEGCAELDSEPGRDYCRRIRPFESANWTPLTSHSGLI